MTFSASPHVCGFSAITGLNASDLERVELVIELEDLTEPQIHHLRFGFPVPSAVPDLYADFPAALSHRSPPSAPRQQGPSPSLPAGPAGCAAAGMRPAAPATP